MSSGARIGPASALRLLPASAAARSVEVELEDGCLKILALHRPVADDLRFTAVILKTSNDLERIAAPAANAPEVSARLGRFLPLSAPRPQQPMTGSTAGVLRESPAAFVEAEVTREPSGEQV